jgi:hypothetical protein
VQSVQQTRPPRYHEQIHVSRLLECHATFLDNEDVFLFFRTWAVLPKCKMVRGYIQQLLKQINLILY